MNYFDRIHYSPDTGVFTWVVSAPGVRAGTPAGHIGRNGYRLIKLGRKQFRACRLAWFFAYGAWPSGEVDHINGDRADDRLRNLRDVDRAANSQNKFGAQKNNLSCGLLGATWNKQHKRWQAKIVARKVRHHLGYFDRPEDAHAAYMAAKARLHIGGCRH